MSSEAESKGGGLASIGVAAKLLGHWLWAALLLVLLCGCLVGLLLGPVEKPVVKGPSYEQLVEALKEDILYAGVVELPDGGNNIPITPALYNALLRDVQRDLRSRQEAPLMPQAAPPMPQAVPPVQQAVPAVPQAAPQVPQAAQAVAPAGQAVAPAAKTEDNCDIGNIRLGFDVRFGPKSQELRAKLNNQPYPTFEQLYFLVVNKPYNSTANIWNTFPNAYNLTANFHFPFSNLNANNVDQAFKMLGRAPKLSVEVGSFHGHSAILQAKKLDQHGFKDTPLLCIDPWTGDLGMLLYRDDWDKKLTPGELADGRSTSYWQFMLNVKQQIEEKNIGPKHIIPMAVTSIVGARYLIAVGLTPDTIYLDSAHEFDETYTELVLYYHTLAAGGVIYGDDFLWQAVAHDVKRFSEKQQLQLITEGNQWFLQKPKGP